MKRWWVVIVATISVLLPAAASSALAGVPPFEAWHMPPGLVLRDDAVRLYVYVQTTDFGPGQGDAYVRGEGQQKFVHVHMGVGDLTYLYADVPAGVLQGAYFEDYVVVRDPPTGKVLRIPSAGAAAPYRSWILNHPSTIALGKHSFGHLRSPDGIVARAPAGNGPGQVGFDCSEGSCLGPPAFAVGPHGMVWVLDPVNRRVLGWYPGHPSKPSRTISMLVGPHHSPVGAADIAVGPDGTVYVTAAGIGHLQLFAFGSDGALRWHGEILSEVLNDHIVSPDGILYSFGTFYGWDPATDASGHPLTIAEQRRALRPYQPLADGEQLVVDSAASEKRQLVAIVDGSGKVEHAWRITSKSGLEGSGFMWSYGEVGGDIVLMYGVYDFTRHVSERVVLRVSRTAGVVRQFSVGGFDTTFGDTVVTALVVGPGGNLYQLRSSPHWGVRIARFSLTGPSS